MINLGELSKFYDKIGYAPHEHIQDFFHHDVFENLRTNFPSNDLFADELPEKRKQNQRPPAPTRMENNPACQISKHSRKSWVTTIATKQSTTDTIKKTINKI